MGSSVSVSRWLLAGKVLRGSLARCKGMGFKNGSFQIGVQWGLFSPKHAHTHNGL